MAEKELPKYLYRIIEVTTGRTRHGKFYNRLSDAKAVVAKEYRSDSYFIKEHVITDTGGYLVLKDGKWQGRCFAQDSQISKVLRKETQNND